MRGHGSLQALLGRTVPQPKRNRDSEEEFAATGGASAASKTPRTGPGGPKATAAAQEAGNKGASVRSMHATG